jgi:hypothetical protein
MNVRSATRTSDVQASSRNTFVSILVNARTSARYAAKLLYLQILSGYTLVSIQTTENSNAGYVVKVSNFGVV